MATIVVTKADDSTVSLTADSFTVSQSNVLSVLDSEGKFVYAAASGEWKQAEFGA